MSIVAVLQGSFETDALTTQSALALARRLNVALTGLCALPDPGSALMLVATPEAAGISATAAKSLFDLQRDMRAAAERAFREVSGQGAHGLETAFVHPVATAGSAAASAATLAEAIVFPRSAARSGEPLSVAFDHVMMEARLPVVLAGNKPLQPGPVIIGWDGSNGASRAVRFHAPLVTAFGEVIIAQNHKDAARDGARPGVAPGLLADWLGRQGAAARTENLEGEVGAALLSLAAGTGASMIVAGAYGHSRLGERLFGGTSRRLLDAASGPALALAR